jgi:hypothetical protein
MSVNQIPAKAGEPITEMYICEVAHVILRVNQLYVFRVHTYCEECLRLAQYSPGFVQVKVAKEGVSMKRKRFEFTVVLSGWGSDADSAWESACEGFVQDPGSTPENAEVVDEEEKEGELGL